MTERHLPKHLLILLAVISLGGCARGLSEQQVLLQAKRCTDAGMAPHMTQDMFTEQVYHISCEMPAEDQK